MAEVPQDLGLVYYTSNQISDEFAEATRKQLLKSADGLRIISVSHKPMNLGENIVVKLPRHHLSIYKQALIGAKYLDTKYIALCEDDVLYSPDHFKHRPQKTPFAYNLGCWSLYTWSNSAMFTYKGGGRINLCNLICEREAFIEAMEERFNKYPDYTAPVLLWAEPGKYERQLGVTVWEKEEFFSNPPNIMFSHKEALQYQGMGERKRLGEMRAYSVPYWGQAEYIRSMYKEKNAETQPTNS